MLTVSLHKNNKSEKLFRQSLADIEEFFDITKPYNEPIPLLLENREVIDKTRGEKTENWMVGWNSGRYIFLLDPDNYEKESKHKYSDREYSRLIKHEVTHYFYKALVGTNNPRWLTEGISVYVSDQIERVKEKPDEFKTFLSYYSKTDSKIYRKAGFAVKILVDTFGKEKLLEFVKKLRGNKTPLDVEKVFEEVFGMKLNYKNMNALLRK